MPHNETKLAFGIAKVWRKHKSQHSVLELQQDTKKNGFCVWPRGAGDCAANISLPFSGRVFADISKVNERNILFN